MSMTQANSGKSGKVLILFRERRKKKGTGVIPVPRGDALWNAEKGGEWGEAEREKGGEGEGFRTAECAQHLSGHAPVVVNQRAM